MSLTLLMLTINGAQKLQSVLPQLAGIGDELVIGIDENTTDDTRAVAEQFSDRIISVPHAGFCGAGQPTHVGAIEYILNYCNGDWILRIDHDETLSPHWHDQIYVKSLLSDRNATHMWIPRRWVLPPGDRYISSRHWHPDHQFRLFRNLPSLIRFPKRAHHPLVMVGEPRFLSDSWIEHWDYVFHDRSIREEKVRFYASLNGYTGANFYLYEEQVFETKPLTYVPSTTSVPQDLASSGQFSAILHVVDRPDIFRAGSAEPVLLSITNTSTRPFLPGNGWDTPANVGVSHHCFHQSGQLLCWDYARTAVPRRILPGESATMFLLVEAPDKPGRYIIQPDIVEEGVGWLSSSCSLEKLDIVVED